MNKTMNIPIFIPHFGCPNDCVFCNQRKISGKDKLDDESQIRELIEESIRTAGERKIEIAFFGGSFTGLPKETQKQYLDLGKEYVERFHLQGIRMSTRPDYIYEEEMDFLSDYPISLIELGVQSLDEHVLRATKRNHSIEDVYKAVQLIKERKIGLGVQMMIGLPGDSKEKVVKTAEKLISMKPETVRIYPTLVIEDTELADMYREGSYNPLGLEGAVEQVAMIMPMFEEKNIQVIRVGLQDNEGLQNGGYIAGPYHPAFKELVRDEIVYKKVMDKVKDYILETACELHCSGQLLQAFIGHKKRNLTRFKSIGINVKRDADLEGNNFFMTVKGRTVFTGVL